jgi:hypothetical protein
MENGHFDSDVIHCVEERGAVMKKTFTTAEARYIGQQIGVDFTVVDLEQFRLGLAVELEHGSEHAETNVTNDDVATTGKIAWAHLKEIPDYYTRLAQMERDAGVE